MKADVHVGESVNLIKTLGGKIKLMRGVPDRLNIERVLRKCRQMGIEPVYHVDGEPLF